MYIIEYLHYMLFLFEQNNQINPNGKLPKTGLFYVNFENKSIKDFGCLDC
jgi:hypothetical protein